MGSDANGTNDKRGKNTGKSFEEAVAAFVQRLAPDAKVVRNYFGRDKETGERQQMDVWVETTIAGHFHLSVLISCKDHNRVLDAGHIREFSAELRDSGASTGIIYSHRGFNDNALKKAKLNGINCCRLLRNEPAELPEALTLRAFFCRSLYLWPEVVIPSEGWGEKGWDEFLMETVIAEGRQRVVVECLEELYRLGEDSAGGDIASEKVFPEPWRRTRDVTHLPSNTCLTLVAAGTWRRFRGKVEAHTADGSYCFSNGHFAGTLSSPVIDRLSENPGPGWEEMTDDVENAKGLRVTLCQVYGQGPTRSLFKKLSGRRLMDSLAVLDHS